MQPLISAILGGLDTAALAVEKNRIVYCNAAAAALGISTDDPIAQLLEDAMPLYASYDHTSSLELAFSHLGTQVSATVRSAAGTDLFFLHPMPEETAVTPAALAKAAAALRAPLGELFTLASSLFPYLEGFESPRIQRETSGMTRRFYRLLREITNLSALDHLQGNGQYRFERVDLSQFFSQLCETARSYLESFGLSLQIQVPDKPAMGDIDCRQMTRAVLNLLANAAQASPDGGSILCRFTADGTRCLLTVKNTCDPAHTAPAPNVFQRYDAPPTSGDGAGLGMALSRSIAVGHGGSVMLESGANGSTTVTMSFPQQQAAAGSAVHTPVLALDDTGGFDQFLIEFSTFLPDSVYDSRNI